MRHLRDGLIVAAGFVVFFGAFIGAGMAADAAPPIVATVVGFIAVCAIIVMVAYREVGR